MSFIDSVIADYSGVADADADCSTSDSIDALRIFLDNTILSLPIGTIYVQSEKKIQIICPILPAPYEKEPELTLLVKDWDPNNIRFQISGDGTLMRLFFYSGTWVKATNYSLDLTKINDSISQTRSFESMWDDAAAASNLDLEKLDPNRAYFFILEHPDNIIIVQHVVPRLIFVGSVDKSKISINLDLTYPEGFQGSKASKASFSFDEVMADPVMRKCITSNLVIDAHTTRPLLADDVKSPITFVGIIATKFPESIRYRFDSPEYKVIKQMRGSGSRNDRCFKLLTIICGPTKEQMGKNNVPIRTNIRSDQEKEKQLRHFLHVLPNYLPLVKKLDVELSNLFQTIFTFYIMLFKDGNREFVDKHFMKFLHKLQEEVYFSDLKPNRLHMTKKHISTFILEQDPEQVAYLLNRMREMNLHLTIEEKKTIKNYLDN